MPAKRRRTKRKLRQMLRGLGRNAGMSTASALRAVRSALSAMNSTRRVPSWAVGHGGDLRWDFQESGNQVSINPDPIGVAPPSQREMSSTRR